MAGGCGLKRWLCLAALVAECCADTDAEPVPWPEDKIFMSGSRRNNYCGLLADVKTADEVMLALAGRSVSVLLSAFSVPGVFDAVTVDSTSGALTGGYLVKILDEMARRGKFTWRSSFAVIESHHNFSEDYDRVVDWGVAKYDLFADFVAWEPRRVARGCLFLAPFMDMSVVLVVQPALVQPPWYRLAFAFLRPFSLPLWAALCLLFLVTAVVYRHLERKGPDFSADVVQPEQTYMQACYLTLSAFTAAQPLAPQSLPGKFYNILFMFSVMLFVASYTANLASLLVVQGQMVAPVESLADAAHLGLPVCNSWPAVAPALALTPMLKVWNTSSPIESMRLVREGKCAAAIGREALWRIGRNTKAYNPDCTLADVPARLMPFRSGFVCQEDLDPNAQAYCTGNAAQVLNTILLRMLTDGWFEKLEQATMHEHQDRSCPLGWPSPNSDDDEDGHPLTVRDFGGIFVLFGIGTVATLVWRTRAPPRALGLDGSEEDEDSVSVKML